MKKLMMILAVFVVCFAIAVPAMAIEDMENTGGEETQSLAGAEANNFTTNNSTNYDKRQLPGATGGPIPNMIAPFHNGGTVGNLQDVRQILSVRKTFTIKQLAVLEGLAKMKLRVRAYQSYREDLGHPEYGIKGLDPEGEITIVIAFPDGNGNLAMPDFETDIAHITTVAKNTSADSVALMAATAIEAYRHGEMARDLRRFLDHRPVRARRPSLAQRLGKWVRRHRAVVWSAGVAAALVIAVLVGSLIVISQRNEDRDAASALARRS